MSHVRDELYSRQVPLAESPPFRLVLIHQPAGDRFLLNANHSAFDGFGCLRLLHSTAHHYAGSIDPPPAVDLEEAREVQRHLAAPDRRSRARRFRLLASKATDLVRRPARLATDGGHRGPGYRVHVCTLTEEQTRRLGGEGRPTINDLLVASTRAAWFSAPARMPCGLSLGAVTVGGCLHLSFRARTELLGPNALRRFDGRFGDDLLALAEAGR